MNKREFCKEFAEKTEMTAKQAEAQLDVMLGIIEKVFKACDKLVIKGFGTFKGKHRDARKAKNLATGKEITVPACIVPAFRPKKELKERLNSK